MQIPSQLMTLPNQLTLSRIVAVPVICLFVASGWEWLRWIALLLDIAAAITDWLDGFLARRMKLNSALGKMLDPIADKLLVGGLLVTLAWTRDLGALDLIPAIAILMREMFIAGFARISRQAGDRGAGEPARQVEDHRATGGARLADRCPDAGRASSVSRISCCGLPPR